MVTAGPPNHAGPPVDAAQAAPARGQATLIWGGLAIGLALTLTLVWALGGFGSRRDEIVAVAPGTNLQVGPYELVFGAATAQHKTSSGTYEVVVTGTGRTTSDTTIAPRTGESGFLRAQSPATGEVQLADSFDYGDSQDVSLRTRAFTPGLAAISFATTFVYEQPVSDELLLEVFDQEFFDNYVFSDDEPAWNTVSTGYSMVLPVTVLPEEKI